MRRRGSRVRVSPPGAEVGLTSSLRQAEEGAGATRLPVLVLHQEGERAGRDLVCMRRDDFAAWFGELQTGQGGHDDATQTESA